MNFFDLNRIKAGIQNFYYSISLKTKILVPTLVVVLSAFVIFTIYLVNNEKNKLNRELVEKSERLTFLLTNSNIGYIWRMDNESLEKNVKSFFDDKDITKIVIKDEFDNVLINLSRKIKGENDIVRKAEFTKENVSIGTLEVVYTDYYIGGALSAILYKLVILTLIVYVLVTVLITVMSNLVIRPLLLMMDKVKILSEGDLTQSLLTVDMNIRPADGTGRSGRDMKTRDEIGILAVNFNSFVLKITEVIGGIKSIAEQLALSSQMMKSTTNSFTDNAQSQAATVEEITATIDHVSAGMDSVANDAIQQSTDLNELNRHIQDLSVLINEMGESMQMSLKMAEDISMIAKKGDESLRDMNISISTIKTSSGEMINIVNIINDISDQINILSLNAAIEAARAGEAGRGFAVVADEISMLADLTAKSMGDIGKLINMNDEEIRKGMINVSETVANTRKIIDGVNSISEMVKRNYSTTRRQLQASSVVSEMANRVNESAQGIKVAADEQKNATSEIVNSIANINDLIQSNAAGAEEVSANSMEVNTTAEELKEKVDFFKI